MKTRALLSLLFGSLPLAVAFALCALLSTATAASSGNVAHFVGPLTPKLPYDVDLDLLRQLSSTPEKSEPPFDIPDENIPSAQRLFDLFAWQSFVALNWPAKPDGLPDLKKTLADSATARVWEHYVDAGLVYQENGEPPPPWDEAVKTSWTTRTFWMSGMAVGEPPDDPQKPGGYRHPVLDESLQAFTGPMIDQNGKWVRYQEVLNPIEYDYVVKNKLYSLEGQAEFTSHHKIGFPANQGTHRYGAMEVKTSWKQLGDNDDRARFLVRHAKVIRLDGTSFEADFGLVGLHIAVRTESSPTWIWATFEQVDNTNVNDLERDSHGHPLRPNFFNPDNFAKPVNVLAPKNAAPVNQYNPATGKDDGPAVFTSWDESKTTDPTQTLMVLPIPKATAALNREVQGQLAALGSVFQYYELIGSQWPAQPDFPAFPNGVAAQPDGRLLPASFESILFKVPGKVVPVNLVNTTMETFFQNGNQPAGPVAADDRLAPGLYADPSTIFGTESCAGCHFSAGACIAFKKDANGHYLVTSRGGKYYRIPVYGQNASRGLTGNADYSWLLQLRAQSAPYEPKPGEIVTAVEQAFIVQSQKACPAQ